MVYYNLENLKLTPIFQHQKKGILPAFNAKVIRGLYPLFWAKASELVSLMKQDIIMKRGSSRDVKIDIESV